MKRLGLGHHGARLGVAAGPRPADDAGQDETADDHRRRRREPGVDPQLGPSPPHVLEKRAQALRVHRKPIGTSGPHLSGERTLGPDPMGRAWLVTASDGAAATARFWQLLLAAETFAP